MYSILWYIAYLLIPFQLETEKPCLLVEGNPICLKKGETYKLIFKPGMGAESFSMSSTGCKLKMHNESNTYTLRVAKNADEVKIKLIEERNKATREQHETWFVFTTCEN